MSRLELFIYQKYYSANTLPAKCGIQDTAMEQTYKAILALYSTFSLNPVFWALKLGLCL